MRLRGNIKLLAGAAALVVLAAVIVILVVFFTRSQEPEIPGLVSTSVEGEEQTILENESGARIVVPALESSEGVTVSIREVAPPVSHVSVGEVFDFSITDEAGQDVSLDEPVAITLPYSLPEGREHSDVVVLHWNETEGKWDPVEGGDIDQAAQTITVQVSHLSTFGISWLLTFAEFLADSAEALIGATFGQHYEQGNKHLLALKAAGGTHKVNGEVSLIIDVDDLLGITAEGEAGYVTTWLNVTAGLGQISWSNTLPVGIYFFVHDRSDGDDDPRFKAKFKSLSGSAARGGHVVGLEVLTVTNGKINPAGGNYQVCLTCTENTLGVSLSWADLTWNASRAELRLRPDDSLFDTLKGSLGPIDGSTEEISAEEFASEVIGSTFEVIGDQVRAIFDEPSAPFTSYDQPSPEAAIDWYGSLQNQIVGHCGGENRYGPSSRLCSDGDMIFPSATDSSGSPVVETQLELYVKGDARETRDYFVKLVDISPGWEIKVDRDSIRWSTLVTLLLYDDRAQFEARAGAVHFIPFLVGNTSFAPNPGVATFELVHVKGFADDDILDRYRVELWQGREVSDLSVTATPNSVEATSGDSTTLVANVTNRGPNSVNQVALHIDVTDSENILFSSASTSGGVNPCRTLYFGKLLCELSALNPNQSATVNLNFSLSGSGSPIGGDYVHLQVSSPVYDPQSSNNYLTSTILISPSTTGPTQPQPPPPIVQPPPPTDASDREALIALYDATRGEIWYNNRNGNEVWEVDEENSDISSWHRVTVNGAGRVTELYLYSNDLRYDRDHRNSLPPELGNLAYLEWLDLSRNDLRGRIPDAFGNLRNLVELHLNNNSLGGNVPASLGNLTNLESLDLSDNNLSGEIPIGLGHLPRMDVVYLGGNNLSGCIPAEWRRIQGDLDELDLPFCDVALNDLTISPGRLSPEFEVSESSYTAEIPAYETTITPANYQGASFQFLDAGGNVLTDADAARPGHQVQLTAATTTVTILVTSRDGGEDASYTIEISRSPGAPGAPVMNPATPGPSTLALSWSAPSNSGTSPISSYSLRYRVAGPGGGALTPWTVVQSIWNPSLGGLSYDLTGLQPSVQYELQMRAVNNSGPSPWSATVTGATVSALPPGMPLNSAAAPAGQTGIRLSWGRPSSDGGSPITGYRIQASEDGSTWATLVANARPGILTYSHTALSAGSTWHYRVAAINSVGQSPWSNVATASTPSSVTPQVPAPPVNPASTPTGPAFARDPAQDFDTLSAAGNTSPLGIWSDGITMWVVNRFGVKKIYAYSMTTKTRDHGKDFDTLEAAGNNGPQSIWSDGTTMWVADGLDNKIYAYRVATKARDPDGDFDAPRASGNSPDGLWSDGTTMWAADTHNHFVYAYNMASKARDPDKDFDTLSTAGNSADGFWSDGTSVWVPESVSDKLYAYNWVTKARDVARDFNTLSDAGNQFPRGIWSNGATMWVADQDDNKIYAYNMPPGTGTVVGAGTEPAAPRGNGVSYAFQSFHVISSALDEYGDHDTECKSVLGNQYRLADWNDLTTWVSGGGSIPELIAGLRLRKEGGPASIYPHDGAEIDGSLPKVSLNGEERLNNGRRHFFISRHDHVLPGYFLAHAHIDNYHISLGSWYGEGGTTLCYNMPPGTGTVVGTGTEPAAPMANGISYAFQSFHVISSALDEYGDHDAECKSRLDNQYRLADWNDLTSWVSGGGSIPELIVGLRLRKEGDPASIYPHDGAEIDGSLPKVSLDGEERLNNGRRHFFISRHDHVLPGYFLAHAHIDNYHISLGSWYGEGGTTLCYNPTL